MKKTVIAALFLIFFLSAPINAEQTPVPLLSAKKNILIAFKPDAPRIEQTIIADVINDFKQYFGNNAKIELLLAHALNETLEQRREIQSLLDKFKTDLIFLVNINSPHTFNFIKDIPIIHVSGYSPRPLGDNFTEITLYIPPKLQLSQLKRAFPKIKRVGLFHSPESKFPLTTAKKAARRLDIDLIVQRITSNQNINDEIENMLTKHMIHAFWLVPDFALYKDQEIKSAFLHKTIAMGIPVLTFFSDHLIDGAFMAVEFDFSDLGKQAARMAGRILFEEMPVQNLRSEAPRKSVTLISVTVLKKSFLWHMFDPRFVNEVYVIEGHPNYKSLEKPFHLDD